MFWKRFIQFFIPSPGALTLTWAALIVALILVLTNAVIGFSEPELRESMVLVISVSAFPVGALLLAIAAFIEKKPGARFALWAAVTGFFVLMGAGLYYAMQTGPAAPGEAGGAAFAFLCCCLPVLALPFFGLIFLGWKALPAFRQTLRAARSQRLVEMIGARGEAALTDLCAELSLAETPALELIEALIADGELMAYFDLENRRVYSAAALNEKQRRLLAMVKTQGKSSLEELAGELKVSRERVRQWTYSLVERKQLHGFADWTGGYIYSRDVENILAQDQCPHCGGRLGVAGKGLIQCEHCGVEVFL